MSFFKVLSDVIQMSYIEMNHFCTNFLERGCQNKSSGRGRETQEGAGKNYVTEFTREVRKEKGTFLSLFWGLVLCLQ